MLLPAESTFLKDSFIVFQKNFLEQIKGISLEYFSEEIFNSVKNANLTVFMQKFQVKNFPWDRSIFISYRGVNVNIKFAIISENKIFTKRKKVFLDLNELDYFKDFNCKIKNFIFYPKYWIKNDEINVTLFLEINKIINKAHYLKIEDLESFLENNSMI